MKALVGAFNQEKALVGAFSVIVQLRLKHYNLSCYRGHGTLGGEQQVGLAAGQRHQQAVVLERDPPEAGAGHRGGLHREPEGGQYQVIIPLYLLSTHRRYFCLPPRTRSSLTPSFSIPCLRHFWYLEI